MDHLSQLPPLLLGEILRLTENFETLQMAISASPALYRVFRDIGPAIIHAVATDTLEPELHQLLYTIARIRNQPVSQSITTLDAFREHYVPDLSAPKRPISPLSVNISPGVCFGLVATVVNVNRLAIALLGELLDRASKLRPQHSVSRTIDFASGAYAPEATEDPWPEGQPAPVARSAIERPPSWVEHYRVQRALWLIQLAVEVRSRAPWMVWRSNQTTIAQNPEWSVSKLLPWLPLAIDAATIIKMLETVVAPRVMSGWDVVTPSRLTHVAMTKMPRCAASDNLGPEPCSEPQNDSIGISYGQDDDAVRESSEGRIIFGQLLLNRHVTLNRAIAQTAIRSGLMIWDRERLCDLGLADELDLESDADEGLHNEGQVRRTRMSDDEIWFAWYSIGEGYVDQDWLLQGSSAT